MLFGEGLYMIMPLPPASSTAALLSTRAIAPRMQTTILLSTAAGSSVPGTQSSASSGSSPARAASAAFTSAVLPTPLSMIEAPLILVPSPRTTVPSKAAWVLAPTVVSHGLAWSRVVAPGPELPADAATKIPAWVALRKASSSESSSGLGPPPMLKLITSTPSMTAWSMAESMSKLKHPAALLASQQTL